MRWLWFLAVAVTTVFITKLFSSTREKNPSFVKLVPVQAKLMFCVGPAGGNVILAQLTSWRPFGKLCGLFLYASRSVFWVRHCKLCCLIIPSASMPSLANFPAVASFSCSVFWACACATKAAKKGSSIVMLTSYSRGGVFCAAA